MNFIAHYHFDKENVNPEYRLGIVMPDLVRIFLNGKHIFPSRIDESSCIDKVKELNQGAKRHLEQDKVFHDSAYFREMMDFSKEVFKHNEVNRQIPKSWFLAHIALELILDRYLIKNVDGIVDDFYTNLDKVEDQHIHSFLKVHDLREAEKFMEKLKWFIEVQYLHTYANDDHLLFALNKIYQRAGLKGEWDVLQKDSLIKCFEPIERETERNIGLLKKELSLF